MVTFEKYTLLILIMSSVSFVFSSMVTAFCVLRNFFSPKVTKVFSYVFFLKLHSFSFYI